MYLIGLTGNIATGKSSVAAILEELGARVIDADVLVHGLMEPGTDVWLRIAEAFGREMLGQGGNIDRSKLAALVFSDPEALRRLEWIAHPAVGAEVERILHRIEEEGSGNGGASDGEEGLHEPVAVLEAIKLLESGLAEECDVVWVVVAPREVQIERLMRTRGLSSSEAAMRIDAQPPQEEKIESADVVIRNLGSLEQLRDQVEELWRRVVAEIAARSR